jgi:hypothetical protein
MLIKKILLLLTISVTVALISCSGLDNESTDLGKDVMQIVNPNVLDFNKNFRQLQIPLTEMLKSTGSSANTIDTTPTINFSGIPVGERTIFSARIRCKFVINNEIRKNFKSSDILTFSFNADTIRDSNYTSLMTLGFINSKAHTDWTNKNLTITSQSVLEKSDFDSTKSQFRMLVNDSTLNADLTNNLKLYSVATTDSAKNAIPDYSFYIYIGSKAPLFTIKSDVKMVIKIANDTSKTLYPFSSAETKYTVFEHDTAKIVKDRDTIPMTSSVSGRAAYFKLDLSTLYNETHTAQNGLLFNQIVDANLGCIATRWADTIVFPSKQGFAIDTSSDTRFKYFFTDKIIDDLNKIDSIASVANYNDYHTKNQIIRVDESLKEALILLENSTDKSLYFYIVNMKSSAYYQEILWLIGNLNVTLSNTR